MLRASRPRGSSGVRADLRDGADGIRDPDFVSKVAPKPSIRAPQQINVERASATPPAIASRKNTREKKNVLDLKDVPER